MRVHLCLCVLKKGGWLQKCQKKVRVRNAAGYIFFLLRNIETKVAISCVKLQNNTRGNDLYEVEKKIR